MIPSRARFFCVMCAAIALMALTGAAQPPQGAAGKAAVRQSLFEELQPVNLANCVKERLGEPNDGGYIVCGNLLRGIQAGYSYGISGYDGWGCDVSRKLKVKVHEYDCFDLRKPSCPAGALEFHPECVAGEPSTQEGRVFDTIAAQFEKNGDSAKRLIMKIDVEGAEWDSFAAAPDEIFEQIDQLVVEFHHTEEPKFVDVVRKLKRFYYVAHLHFNNFSCETSLKPFPAWAYEVLFVNKKLGMPGTGTATRGTRAVDAPNNPKSRDCQ